MTVHPAEWNSKTQRPIEKERRPDLWAIRRQLDDLDAYCRAIYIDSGYGRITVKGFKDKLDLQTGRSEPEAKKPRPTFFEFIDQKLKEMEKQGMRRRLTLISRKFLEPEIGEPSHFEEKID